jgi:hypothetical protein
MRETGQILAGFLGSGGEKSRADRVFLFIHDFENNQPRPISRRIRVRWKGPKICKTLNNRHGAASPEHIFLGNRADFFKNSW